jgi:hypothetical protein
MPGSTRLSMENIEEDGGRCIHTNHISMTDMSYFSSGGQCERVWVIVTSNNLESSYHSKS